MATFVVTTHPIELEDVRGIAVFLHSGEEEHLVARVAFGRPDSRNPGVSFEDQLEAELNKAETAANTLNDALDTFERTLEEELWKQRDRVRDLMQKPRANAKMS